MTTISVSINGTPHRVAQGTTLERLLASAFPEAGGHLVASAVNGDYVPRRDRPSRVLNDHDEVTTFEPITGG